MKAEHRKELQTNILADRMGRLVVGMKSGPRSTSLIIWVIAALAVGTYLVWHFASNPRVNSGLWVRLEEDSYTENLGSQEIIEDLKKISEDPSSAGTIPGRTARFQRARFLLPLGLRDLCSAQRDEAIKSLLDARRLYEGLIPECGDDSLLIQEALLGAAKSEEALVGVPREGEAGTSAGDLDKAVKLYRRLADTYPDSFFGEQASRRAKQIEDNRAAVEKFYTELSKLAAAKK